MNPPPRLNPPRTKADWREEFRARCAQVDAGEALDAARQIADRLLDLQEFRAAARVALYAALPDELSMGFVAERAEADGKSILWPRIRAGVMDFAQARPLELVPGAFGILEPPPEALSADLGSCEVVVVPGRGFDRQGVRLGRGKGHYDRVLGDAEAVMAVGVGFDCQLVDRLPAETHDQKMRAVVTERESLRCGGS